MVSLRKASAYSKKKVRPYTRKSGKKKKAFIKAVPPSKIVKFSMGDRKGFANGKHKFSVKFISKERVQIRDNSLESCRTLLNKTLDKKAPGQYYFEIKVYPHHILRENKMAAGAGADRLSSGMSHSFGVTVGRAAIVNAGKEIFVVTTETEKNARDARDALKMIRTKIPCKGSIVFSKL